MTVLQCFVCLQSECQQLICDILRATPDAASADAAVQTARLASKADPNAARYALTFVNCWEHKSIDEKSV